MGVKLGRSARFEKDKSTDFAAFAHAYEVLVENHQGKTENRMTKLAETLRPSDRIEIIHHETDWHMSEQG